MGTISSNFSLSEFEDSPTAKAKEILNVINTFEIRDSVKALVLKVLQPLLDVYGKELGDKYRWKGSYEVDDLIADGVGIVLSLIPMFLFLFV